MPFKLKSLIKGDCSPLKTLLINDCLKTELVLTDLYNDKYPKGELWQNFMHMVVRIPMDMD